VIGRLTCILTVLKGLPLAYTRDLQEDKGAVFDTADILLSSLEVMAPLMKGVVFKTEKLRETAEELEKASRVRR
jgi:argininosuccinate lyase